MTETPETATVLNSTVLSNFAHVDDVELLLSLPRPVTVEVVRTELIEGAETHPYLERALSMLDEGIPVVTPAQQAHRLETELLEKLVRGRHRAWLSRRCRMERSSPTTETQDELRTNGT